MNGCIMADRPVRLYVAGPITTIGNFDLPTETLWKIGRARYNRHRFNRSSLWTVPATCPRGAAAGSTCQARMGRCSHGATCMDT